MPQKRAHTLSHWSSMAVIAALFTVSQAHAQPHPKPGMPLSERHESKHEIDHLEETWRTAALKHDATAMAALLSDDYIGITANGTLQSKDETLAGLRSGTTQFTQMDLSDRKVRFYARTAVVTSRAEVSGSSPGGDITGSFRYTRIYVRDPKGAWKIVSFEASRIRESDDHK
ncbi:nuclear transport factor 2 family protein [Terracidiphilus gabretensis]|uniref:nuclear transport factor 2 family protein n=1 Tax=Terracidiphilus gabretensis TaxID=1577687 RepID=UPI0009EA5D26|nr:nuclear transport factor 2 family protein [Terracidiphilus gabretensis]